MGIFSGDQKEWLDSLAPSLWLKLELLSKGETWLLDDTEFLAMLDQLVTRIEKEQEYLPELFSDEHFAILTRAMAYMHIGHMIRLLNCAPRTAMFETTVLQWCTDNADTKQNAAACNVLISRFDWIMQQDLNNRIFGKYTRQRVNKLLNTISR